MHVLDKTKAESGSQDICMPVEDFPIEERRDPQSSLYSQRSARQCTPDDQIRAKLEIVQGQLSFAFHVQGISIAATITQTETYLTVTWVTLYLTGIEFRHMASTIPQQRPPCWPVTFTLSVGKLEFGVSINSWILPHPCVASAGLGILWVKYPRGHLASD